VGGGPTYVIVGKHSSYRAAWLGNWPGRSLGKKSALGGRAILQAVTRVKLEQAPKVKSWMLTRLLTGEGSTGREETEAHLSGPLEFHLARQNAAQLLLVPILPLPQVLSATADLAGIQQALRATRHLLEMYRRTLNDESTRRHFQRLDRRLRNVADQLHRLATPPK